MYVEAFRLNPRGHEPQSDRFPLGNSSRPQYWPGQFILFSSIAYKVNSIIEVMCGICQINENFTKMVDVQRDLCAVIGQGNSYGVLIGGYEIFRDIVVDCSTIICDFSDVPRVDMTLEN